MGDRLALAATGAYCGGTGGRYGIEPIVIGMFTLELKAPFTRTFSC